MQYPFFSVIIPTYNRAHLIEETIKSVLAQTFKDFELIIVDDGSTDNTQEVIRKYLSDPRVKYIYQENKERGAARNRGAKEAKGAYLLFFDSDDIALPEHLEKAYRLIMEHGVDKVLWLHGNYSLYVNKIIIKIKKKPVTGYALKKFLKGNEAWICTIFIKKDFFNQLLFDEDRELSGSEDWEFMIRAAFKAPIFYQPESTVLIRQHANRSMSLPQTIERASYSTIKKIFANRELQPFIKRYRNISFAYRNILVAIAWFSASDMTKAGYYLKMSFKETPLIVFTPRFQKWFIRIYLFPFMNFTSRQNRVLYLTYNGLCQPLGQSQVIPYLVGLSREGHAITVLSFEHYYEKDFEKEYQKVKAQLDNAGIGWIALKYHKYPRFFSSVYDIMHGIIKAILFYVQEPYYIVHARSYVPGMMALLLKKLLRTKFIFDMRGMMADEKVDAEQWTRKSTGYKTAKWAERKMLINADAIVVLTDKIKTYLQSFAYINAPITTIPTCVDLNRFPQKNEGQCEQIRKEIGISDRIVIVYSGSIGTWYLFDKMVEFYKAIKAYEPKAHFLLLNKTEHDYSQRILNEHGIFPKDYTIKAVSPGDVYKYLWASDVGIFFIKPSFAKQSSSPTKLAEYLACGLPVIGNAGVGDIEEIILGHELGSLVYRFEEKEYRRAFDRAMQLINDPDFDKRTQGMVDTSLSVKVGVKRYRGIYERL